MCLPLRSCSWSHDAECALVVVGGDDLRLEADLVADAVLVHAGLEVGLELAALREELRPFRIGLEGVAVEVVADVHAAPGVGILEPGSPDVRVLLDHRVRNSGLLEADRREQP
jgi:hypothetical protein